MSSHREIFTTPNSTSCVETCSGGASPLGSLRFVPAPWLHCASTTNIIIKKGNRSNDEYFSHPFNFKPTHQFYTVHDTIPLHGDGGELYTALFRYMEMVVSCTRHYSVTWRWWRAVHGTIPLHGDGCELYTTLFRYMEMVASCTRHYSVTWRWWRAVHGTIPLHGDGCELYTALFRYMEMVASGFLPKRSS